MTLHSSAEVFVHHLEAMQKHCNRVSVQFKFYRELFEQIVQQLITLDEHMLRHPDSAAHMATTYGLAMRRLSGTVTEAHDVGLLPADSYSDWIAQEATHA